MLYIDKCIYFSKHYSKIDITIHILQDEKKQTPPNGGMTYSRSQNQELNPGLSIQRPFPAIIHFFFLPITIKENILKIFQCHLAFSAKYEILSLKGWLYRAFHMAAPPPEASSELERGSQGQHPQIPLSHLVWVIVASMEPLMWKLDGEGEKLSFPGGSYRQTPVRSVEGSRRWKAAEIVGITPWRLLASVLKAK